MVKILLTSDIHRGFSRRTHIHHLAWRKLVQTLDWDVLVCAGDLGTAQKRDYQQALRFLRGTAGDKPVCIVKGNHDLWDKRVISLSTLKKLQQGWEEKYQIINLAQQDWVSPEGKVAILGWDGWYAGTSAPRTNDPNFMPVGGHEWAKWEEIRQMNALDLRLDANGARTKVAVTHFPITPNVGGWRKQQPEFNGNLNHFSLVKDRVAHLLFGHTHHRVEGVEWEGIKLWNAGGDYDKPKHIIIEI